MKLLMPAVSSPRNPKKVEFGCLHSTGSVLDQYWISSGSIMGIDTYTELMYQIVSIRLKLCVLESWLDETRRVQRHIGLTVLFTEK